MIKRTLLTLTIILLCNVMTSATDYILMSPLANNNVYLVDRDGNVAQEWQTKSGPGLSAYLMSNGNLIRSESVKSKSFKAGGAGGRVAIYDKGSNLIWSYELNSSDVLSHHDIEVMPNGNILIIAWEKKSREDAILNGVNPKFFDEKEIWSDYIIELDPNAKEVVWEWHVWDHLVQDFDSAKKNFGVVSKNLDKININYFGSKDKVDWIHLNSIDYSEAKDQILVSSHSFSELWIIEHGADNGLEHRWGNPEAVDKKGDRTLYFQHDGAFLENGNVLVFNNGDRRAQPFSEVLEFANITETPEIVWSYLDKDNFYATNISGAQRLDNGNTLICNGPSGYVFEVTPDNDIVWSYTNPYFSKTPKSSINEIFRAESYSGSYSGIIALLK